MQADRFALAGVWIAAAQDDAAISREIASRHPNAACFHAQQSGEKALKGLLIARCGDAPRTHLAATLLDELRESGIALDAEIERAARSLDKLYLPTRYPDSLGGASPAGAYDASEAELALDRATSVLLWCSKQIDRERRE